MDSKNWALARPPRTCHGSGVSASLPSSSGRRLLWILAAGGAAGVGVAVLNPVNSLLLRAGLLGSAALLWAALLLLAWRVKPLRLALALLAAAAVLPFLLPGRAIDGAELAVGYVRGMSDYEGTRYHWGGESGRGIDCSGLPRRALRDALLDYGLRHGNGRAFREFASQWWYDTSAKAMGEGYRGNTRPLGRAGTVRTLDPAALSPGDLAVTDNGVHVMAYAGEGRWIQADPGIGAVATLDGRTADNAWFDMPVTVHRWKFFTMPAAE
jgi:hypothetical protein